MKLQQIIFSLLPVLWLLIILGCSIYLFVRKSDSSNRHDPSYRFNTNNLQTAVTTLVWLASLLAVLDIFWYSEFLNVDPDQGFPSSFPFLGLHLRIWYDFPLNTLSILHFVLSILVISYLRYIRKAISVLDSQSLLDNMYCRPMLLNPFFIPEFKGRDVMQHWPSGLFIFIASFYSMSPFCQLLREFPIPEYLIGSNVYGSLFRIPVAVGIAVHTFKVIKSRKGTRTKDILFCWMLFWGIQAALLLPLFGK